MDGQNLMLASIQWATRPADERFANIIDLIQHLRREDELSKEILRPVDYFHAEGKPNGDVTLVGKQGETQLTHWSFDQLSSMAGLSGTTLRAAVDRFVRPEQASRWVAEGINLGLEGRLHEARQPGSQMSDQANMLVRLPNGKPMTLRSITTDKYSRIKNLTIAQQLLRPLTEYGFTNPPAMDGPAGLYCSDRDMFAFMAPMGVARINMPGVTDNDGGLGGFDVGGQQFYPFLITGNSEEGKSSAWFMSGLLQAICGNHIIWGAQDVHRFSVRHTGEALKRFEHGFYNYLRQWVTAGTLSERQALQAALVHHVAKDKDGTVEFLRGRGFTKKVAEEAVATVEAGDKSTGIHDQDVTKLFNLVSAITANAREIQHQDARVQVERAAGKLLALAVR